MFVRDIVEIYLNSRAFLENIRSDQTRGDYKYYLSLFSKQFSNYSRKKMQSDHFVEEFECFLKSMQATPRKAEYCLATIRAMFNWAVRKKLLKSNPIKYVHFKRLAQNSKTRFWTDELIDFTIENFPKPLKEYVIFATETGLRNCDLIRLRKSEHLIFEGEKYYFQIIQSKTQKMVKIKCSQRLLEHIQQRNHKSDYCLVSATGKPWTKHSFRSAWSRIRKKFISDYDINLPKPHDLRKVTARYLIQSDATVPQASSILGIDTYTFEKYYFQKETISDIAINKLDAKRTEENRPLNRFKKWFLNLLSG